MGRWCTYLALRSGGEFDDLGIARVMLRVVTASEGPVFGAKGFGDFRFWNG